MNKLRKRDAKCNREESVIAEPKLPNVGAASNLRSSASASHSTLTPSPSIAPPPQRALAQVGPAPQHYPPAFQPRTAAEHYWAARALAAETLLVARATHYEEMKRQRYSDEVRRARELDAVTKASEARLRHLERVIYVLVLSLVTFTTLAIYRISHPRPPSSKWYKPSHFTIPILSPFTSVIEHETSAFGFRTVAITVVVLGVLAYGMFRHWMNRPRAH